MVSLDGTTGIDGGAHVLFQANATLGEGPVWDDREGALYWVDIRRQRISRLDPRLRQQTGIWVMPDRVGCIGLTDDVGTLVVGAGANIVLLHLGTGKTDRIATLPIDTERYRINDGRVDTAGRLWVGTMIDDIHAPDVFSGGRLFRVSNDGEVWQASGEFELPNGIVWTGDDASLLINDTTACVTYRYRFDSVTGEASDRTVFFDHSGRDGYPDGLSIDTDGCLWSAQWDGWNIRRISPNAELLAEYRMPVRRPSSATFFGRSLDRIAITSATVDFSTEDFLQSPDAGSIFEMDGHGASGRPENRFGQMRTRKEGTP